MKTRAIRLSVVMFAVAFLSTVLLAQIVKTPLFHVDVPFTFMAGGVHLPAGPYIISRYDPHLIEIEALDGKARSLVYVMFEDKIYHTPLKITHYAWVAFWVPKRLLKNHCQSTVDG